VSQNADFQISGAIQWDWARRFVKEILLSRARLELVKNYDKKALIGRYNKGKKQVAH
jgi:hypothetical protein